MDASPIRQIERLASKMPPNQTLIYENEDAELVPSYEKKGKQQPVTGGSEHDANGKNRS